MNNTRKIVIGVLAAGMLLLAACGSSDTGATGAKDSTTTASKATVTTQVDKPVATSEATTTTAAKAECVLVAGATISKADWEKGICLLNGEVPAYQGYTDCKDGSDLEVVGENDGSDGGGYVLFAAGGTTGVWTDGAWEAAWNTCYGY